MLADGQFPQQADKLRLYRRLATMDANAPLPPISAKRPTWSKAAILARQWELNALAERLEQLAAA